MRYHFETMVAGDYLTVPFDKAKPQTVRIAASRANRKYPYAFFSVGVTEEGSEISVWRRDEYYRIKRERAEAKSLGTPMRLYLENLAVGDEIHAEVRQSSLFKQMWKERPKRFSVLRTGAIWRIRRIA